MQRRPRLFSELTADLFEALNEEDAEERAEHSRQVEEDLQLADRLHSQQASSDARMQRAGWLADRIAWRQLPLMARHALIKNDAAQAFETRQIRGTDLKSLLWPVSFGIWFVVLEFWGRGRTIECSELSSKTLCRCS